MRFAPIMLATTLAACSSGTMPNNQTTTTDTNIVDLAATPSANATMPATPSPTSDRKILTANGWGPLKVGMTKAEVTDALGPDANPGNANGAEPDTCEQYRPERAPKGMLVMLEKGALSRITVTRDATVETAEGIATGASADAVKAVYGQQIERSPHKYVEPPAEYLTVWTTGGDGSSDYIEDSEARGIRFEIDREGQIQSIHAGGPSIQYVEGCS